MRDLRNEKPIVFVEGDEDRVVIEKENYGTSLFSSQYTTAFGILKRLIETSDDECYPGQGNSRIIAFCGDRGAGKTSCMMSVRYAIEHSDKEEIAGYLRSNGLRKADLNFDILNPIDPSFFDESHNILELVLGQMYLHFKDRRAKLKENKELRNAEVTKVRECFDDVKRSLSLISGSSQKMFMMLGAAEKAGSGVDKILKGWSDSNWRSPYIETSFRPDTINLYLPMVSLLDENVKNGLIRLFGKGVVHVKHNWLMTLALTLTEGYVTNERLRYALKIHKADIYTLLKDMCNGGYLIAEGHGRGTKYYLPIVDANIGSNIGSNVGSNPISNPVSNPISKPKKRMSREEIREAIISVSADWVSLDYIAKSIGRNTDYLLAHVIPSMLEEGIIERMYPDSPRNPYQKYKKRKG